MRARGLKPGLFKNEVLGSADPLLTILFEGLWCMADRAGRLEDRPLRICAEVFPYRRGITETRADGMLAWLHDRGFVTRYELAGKRFVQVLEFEKHQRPHPNESPSSIQPLTSPDAVPRREVLSTKVHTRGEPRTEALCPSSLTPSSLTPSSLTPDNPETHQGAQRRSRIRPEDPPEFSELKSIYPKRSGDQPWSKALKAINARLREGSTWNEILQGARRYAAYIRATGKEGSEYVKHAASFCGPDKVFLQPFNPPIAKETPMEEILRLNGKAQPNYHDDTVIDHDADPYAITR